MNDKSDSQNELNRVLEKIQEIVKKSADGDYIYRGEPEDYEQVSSSLWRECRKEIGTEITQRTDVKSSSKTARHLNKNRL